MRDILRIIVAIASFLASLALILACIAGFVSPKHFWPIAMFGLSFPILFITNCIFALFWLILRKKEIIISLIALFFSIWQIPQYAAFNGSSVKKQDIDSLRVMTYNVHLFTLYDIGDNQKDNMFQFIQSKNADVICFQEFFVLENKLTEKEIKKYLKNYPYSFINYKSNMYGSKAKFGTAIFSKYPIINKQEIKFGKTSNSSIYADLKVKKDTIRIFCNHLESVKLKEVDKPHNWGERIANKTLSIDNLKAIVKKLRKAYIIRAAQVDSIRNTLDKTSYPTILCGDFNDLPASYTYRSIKGNMNDSFVDAGQGITQTYQGLLPTMRIDFVFSDESLKAYRYSSPKVKYSDHYPIIVDFSLAAQDKNKDK